MRTATNTVKKAAGRVAAVAAIAMVASTLQLTAPAEAAASGPNLVPAAGRLVGLRADSTNAIDWNYKNAVDRRELDAGRKLDVLSSPDYASTEWFPTWREQWMAGTGHIPLVNWSSGYSPSVANGSIDWALDARARDIKAFGKPMFLRYGASMDTKDWATIGTPEAFVSAWRRAHDRFAAAGVTNVSWVWCPSQYGWANGTAMRWYPGDAYVDWTCAEGMNWGAPWTPFMNMVQPFVNLAPWWKPQMVTFGSYEGTPDRKAAWINGAFNNIASSFPNIKAAVYEDRGPSSLWTSDSARSAFNAGVVDPALYRPAPVDLPSGKLVPSGPGAYIGTFQPLTTTAEEMADINALEAGMGRKEDIAHVFYGWSQTFPTWRETWNLQNGRIPLISWTGTKTTEVTAGWHDNMIRTRARSLKALPGKVFLRWFWEMDDATLDWQTVSAPSYISAWQRIHTIFQQEGAANVAFVWSPNAWGVQIGTAQAFYPGAQYVDWIAADGYNWAPKRPNDPWVSFTNVFSAFYAWAATMNKPLMIPEVGAMERNRWEKSQWLLDMGTSLKVQFPLVRALVYFDHATTSYTDGATVFPWTINSSQDARWAWNAMVWEPHLRPAR